MVFKNVINVIFFKNLIIYAQMIILGNYFWLFFEAVVSKLPSDKF